MLKTDLAGVLRSDIALWDASPSIRLRFFDSTLTTIRTGFRSPTLTSSERASVIVALKSPVLRCLGKCEMMRVSEAEKPKSRSLNGELK